MQELLNNLIATLQALMVLLAAQGGISPELQNQVSAVSTAAHSQAVQVQAVPTGQNPFTTINQTKAGAVVNILCRGGSTVKSGTSSGVIISPTGHILTNAHMAQYMLLEQATSAPISCIVRTGSPAKDMYKAEVVYISSDWVEQNAHQITKGEQIGTGEDDYAILQIVGVVRDGQTLPSPFTHLPPNTGLSAAKNGQSVLVRAYPAEFLGSAITVYSLRPTATVAQLQEVATFKNGSDDEGPATPDLISLGGSIVAQGGSSGGGIIDALGNLIGIIVTSTRRAETKDRELKAITLSHINESLHSETGISLAELLATPEVELQESLEVQLLESAELLVGFINN